MRKKRKIPTSRLAFFFSDGQETIYHLWMALAVCGDYIHLP